MMETRKTKQKQDSKASVLGPVLVNGTNSSNLQRNDAMANSS